MQKQTKKLLLASGNKDKLDELRSKISPDRNIDIFTPKMFGITIDVPEDGTTLEENAALKADAFFRLFAIPSLADDTGLFVTALGGHPGVHSARYAGEDASYEDNRIMLLKEMSGIENRSAEFRTVIAFRKSPAEILFFRGSCRGKISFSEKGTNGFGYDPIFIPEGFDTTFAEMSPEQKNGISHRARAVDSFLEYLNENKYPVEDSNL